MKNTISIFRAALFIIIFPIIPIFANDSIINLLYYHPSVKILDTQKSIAKKVSPNTYIAKVYGVDSRFINSQEKVKGVDIVKKTVTLSKNSKLEFKISKALNHTLHFSLRKNKGKQEIADSVQIYLNDKTNDENLKSDLRTNYLRIEAKEEVTLENLFLIQNGANKDKPDILFIVIDSLRADVCGFNGANFNVTPNLDTFAKSANVFQEHLVNSSWTRPSTLIFFTGLYPSKSFINLWDYTVFPEEKKSFYKSGIVSLPANLAQNGYKPVMIGNNPFLTDHRGIGVDVGFEEVYDYSYYENDTLPITEKILSHLKSLPPKEKRRPEFIFLNYNDPHKPYTPPATFLNQVKNADKFDSRKKDYLGEVAYVDSELDKIFQTLKEKGLSENTLILITSDHGEVMNPNHAKSKFTGVYTLFGHGQGLYEEDIHTPLILKLPHQKEFKKITSVSRSIDLMPTILEAVKLQKPQDIDGESLFPILEGKEQEERLYYGESRGVIGVRKDGWKWMQKVFYFHRPGAHWDGQVTQEPMYLFNYKSDPEENSPVENETQKREFKKLADSFLKKTSIYAVRITNPPNSESKEISISVHTDVGKVVLTDEKGNAVKKEEFTFNHRGFSFTKSIHENSSIEFSFVPYPDITFPKFDIKVNGKHIGKGELGVGEKDIYPGKCHNKIECAEIYLIKNKKPDLPNQFRAQVWLETKSLQLTNQKVKLENDAIDILKKQGYIK
ncbi:MAG: sulfatase [Leptospiraceae bacterium]|nr:sulfatase [Leptospiraceae bacterium]